MNRRKKKRIRELAQREGISNRAAANRLAAEANRRPATKLTVVQALAIVDDDLPDGAWMQTLCDLTGLDAGDVSAELAQLNALSKEPST